MRRWYRYFTVNFEKFSKRFFLRTFPFDCFCKYISTGKMENQLQQQSLVSRYNCISARNESQQNQKVLSFPLIIIFKLPLKHFRWFFWVSFFPELVTQKSHEFSFTHSKIVGCTTRAFYFVINRSGFVICSSFPCHYRRETSTESISNSHLIYIYNLFQNILRIFDV